MTLKTNHKTFLAFLVLSICFTNTSNAQFWKKLKKKVQQKVENKIDKQADKLIDSTLNGKKKKKEQTKKTNTTDERLKSYGNASISHSLLYGMFSVNDLSKTKVHKEGKKVTIKGSWRTSNADVFDGYILEIKHIDDIDNLKNKTFKIPEEASLKLAYNALVKGKYEYKRGQVHAPQNIQVNSGTATVTFNKDQNVSINFSANVKLSDYNKGELAQNDTPATINGMVNTTSPEFRITRLKKEQQKDPVDKMSEDEKMKIFQKMTPTVNIPSTFSFHKSISVKITDDRGDAQTLEFLIGQYPDIYGLFMNMKEMGGQNMMVVNTPKASTMFMSMAGMKIKKTTSLAQVGGNYNLDDKLPEDGDFAYKKTGNTKTILGYKCEEVRVDFDYTNAKGSAIFWVSKEFPIQNKAIPMLGMKMNNPYFSGFVLELNTTQNGKTMKMEVVKVSDKNVSINTSEYKKMGF